jgi:hypothetical protein
MFRYSVPMLIEIAQEKNSEEIIVGRLETGRATSLLVGSGRKPRHVSIAVVS